MSRRDHPWSKFWWEDYERDDGLALCGLAAQGLWMRMLCKMHAADPMGYLTVNGAPVSCETLAKLVSIRRERCAKLLSELEENGVFSRDESGVIFCRRMVREKENQEVARINGSRGGNPALSKGLTPPVNGSLKLQEARSKKLEAEEERKNPQQPSAASPPRPSPKGSRLPEDWQPDDAARQFAVGLGLRPDAVRERFCDYWHAKAGRDAAKLDWPATWRSWCRRDADNALSAKPFRNGFLQVIAEEGMPSMRASDDNPVLRFIGNESNAKH
jgi:hypothetical protein